MISCLKEPSLNVLGHIIPHRMSWYTLNPLCDVEALHICTMQSYKTLQKGLRVCMHLLVTFFFQVRP